MKDITLKPPRRPNEEYADMLQDYVSRRVEIMHTAERAPDKDSEDFTPATTALTVRTGEPALTEGVATAAVNAVKGAASSAVARAKDAVTLNPKPEKIDDLQQTDSKGNVHNYKIYRVGNKTYSVDSNDKAVEYDPNKGPKTLNAVVEEESRQRKRNALKAAGMAAAAVGTIGWQAYKEHKKKKEEEAARKKAEEDARNSRIDVRLRKALEGDKDNGKRGKKKPQNESAQSEYESDVTALKSKYAQIGAESGIKVLKDFKKENPKAYKDLRNRVIKGGVSYVKTNAGPALHEYREIRRKYKKAKKAEKEMEKYVQESVSMIGVLELAVSDFAYRTSAGIS